MEDYRGLSKSQFAESILRLKGKRYSLDRYPMFRDIFDLSDSAMELLLKTGRQVSKSTFNSKDIVIDSLRIPHFNTLFITPLQEQTARFSRNYLSDDIRNTPFIQKYYWDTSCQDNVFSRGFTNGSLVQLTYSLLDAERARGIPADKLVFDEVQDIPWGNIPIINECLSASEYKWINYTGTPKTMDNTIEQLWRLSTKCEWAVTCAYCRRTNIPDEENVWEMIGEEFPQCAYCKSDIRTEIANGRWVTRNPDYADPKKCQMVGFHLPQIIMPIHYELDNEGENKNWMTLKKKQSRYARAQFANECLGLSFDQGGRLVTITELVAISTGKLYNKFDPEMNIGPLYAGIDWGISAQTSYSFITIGGFDLNNPHKFKVVYMKRFSSTDTLEQIDEMLEICHQFNVKLIGADCGVGHTNNIILRRNYGENRVLPFNYATSAYVTNYNKGRMYHSLDKTTSLNLMFMAIKQKLVEFPNFEWMKANEFYKDFLALYEEIVESTRGISKVFKHNPKDPDDGAHALNFCMFAAYVDQGHEVINMATNHDYLLDDRFGPDRFN